MNIATLSAFLIATLADPITWICSLLVAFFARWVKWPIALLVILALSWPISFVRGHLIESAKYKSTGVWDEDYDVLKAIVGTRFEAHHMKFVIARNRENGDAFKVQIDRDVKDCATLLGATKATNTPFRHHYRTPPPNGSLMSGADLLSDCKTGGRTAGAIAAFLVMFFAWGTMTLIGFPKAADRY